MKINNFGNIEEYFEIHQKIFEITKKIRSKKQGELTNWQMPAEMHLRKSTYNGRDTLTLTITLTPIGCEWARKGGCTMCGEFESTTQKNELLSDPKFHITQFVRGLTNESMLAKVHESGLKISRLRIYQEGNYTNTNETSKLTQETILRLATLVNGVKKITIESRPQFLTEESISFLSDIVRKTDVKLEIGMGVEAKNNIVRNICINKSGTDEQFVNAVSLLKKYDISPLAYVILKPPFLSEQEAITEAISTIGFANEIGFERISLEPMTIHGYTLVDALHKNGLYETPWLWSVVEVLRQCANFEVKPGVGGIGYFPVPQEYSQNKCEHCNRNIIDAIVAYNKNKDISALNNLTCPHCLSKWERLVNATDDVQLLERIKKQLAIVDDNLDKYEYEEKGTKSYDGRTLYKYAQY